MCISEANLDLIASTSSVEEVGVVRGNRARWNWKFGNVALVKSININYTAD